MRRVNLERLGKCERCGGILKMFDLPPNLAIETGNCSKCNAPLTLDSFGLTQTETSLRKTKWLGPDGQWTNQRPERDFVLNNIVAAVEFYPVLV